MLRQMSDHTDRCPVCRCHKHRWRGRGLVGLPKVKTKPKPGSRFGPDTETKAHLACSSDLLTWKSHLETSILTAGEKCWLCPSPILGGTAPLPLVNFSSSFSTVWFWWNLPITVITPWTQGLVRSGCPHTPQARESEPFPGIVTSWGEDRGCSFLWVYDVGRLLPRAASQHTRDSYRKIIQHRRKWDEAQREADQIEVACLARALGTFSRPWGSSSSVHFFFFLLQLLWVGLLSRATGILINILRKLSEMHTKKVHGHDTQNLKEKDLTRGMVQQTMVCLLIEWYTIFKNCFFKNIQWYGNAYAVK